MPFRFVNLPPRRRPGGGQAVRLAALDVISAGFCRKSARRRGGFPFHIVLIWKGMFRFLQVTRHFVRFRSLIWRFPPVLVVLSVVAAACRMVTAWDRDARRRWRSPSARCSSRNIGRRATPLPSPLRRSFLSVIVSGWWSPFRSGVLLLWVSRWGFWCSFLPCWVWLYTGVYSSLFNRARNKRARTREGLPLLFPVSFPSAGLPTAFFSGGRCRGIASAIEKRGGAFLSVFYISGGKVKNLHGHKISTAGAVLVPSWRCWFGLLRLSVLGQVVTISAGLGLPWKSPAHA